MPGLAVTACRRCREQKLRCSRDVPTCSRCARLGAECIFPPPPDRKVLAALRAPPKRRSSARARAQQALREHRPSEVPQSTSATYSIQPTVNSTITNSLPATESELQLPANIHKLLQEVYFTHMFHASLLFHRPTFTRAFEEGNVVQHVLLGMYATSTIFLHAESPEYIRHADQLQSLGDIKALGQQWAIHSGRQVLQDIDQPTFESVQTCEILSLYWFSAGGYHRNTMFLGIAYKAACVLGMDGEDGHKNLSSPTLTSEHVSEWLKGELVRRCFWAVWYTQCINSDHHLTDAPFDTKVMKLPLPADESSYLQSRQVHVLTLSTVLDETITTSDSEQPSRNSIWGELMTLMWHWAKIRNYTSSRKTVPARDWLTDAFELEAQLSRWRSGISEAFAYSKENLYHQLVVNEQSLYIFLHTLYHQCRLVLHSSLVPQFSGLPLPKTVPAEVLSVSARIALRSAQEISILGADLLALDWDPGRVPAFAGYCMYVSASIHITVLGSKDARSVMRARTHLVSNLKWLKSMKVYWSNLERLWARAKVLYATQMSRQALPNDNTGRTARSVSSASSSSNASHNTRKEFDQLASQVRDTGQLSEPLADSVLEYSLHNLRSDLEEKPLAKRQPIRITNPVLDQLTQLMDDENDLLYLTDTSIPSTNNTRDQPMQNVGDKQPNRDLLTAQVPAVIWNWANVPEIPVAQPYGYDWWEFDLPSDDLFGFNTSMWQ